MLGSIARLAVCCLVLSSLTSAASSAVIIDDFTDTAGTWPQRITATDPNVYLWEEWGLADVLGGYRGVELGQVVMDFDGLDEVAVRVFTGGPGIFDYAASVGAVGVAKLNYNVAADLSATPLVELSLLRFDAPGGADMAVTLVATTTDLQEYTYTSWTNGKGPQTVSWLLDGAWLSDVARLSVRFDGVPVGGDFRIDAITADVPEPATVMLLGLGSLLVLARRGRARDLRA